MNFHTDYNRLPYDLDLQWDGWRSTIGDLARSGWEMKVVMEPERMESVIVMKNEKLSLTGHGGMTVIQWHEVHHYPHTTAKRSYDEGNFAIRMYVGGNVTVQSAVRLSPEVIDSSKPVELGSYYEPDSFTIMDLFNKPPPEIVIEKRPEVIDLLNQIKDMQNPRAKELLAQERKKGQVHSFETAANVIAIR